MRILGKPDSPHVPRNDVEAHLCAVLEKLTGQDISRLATREEYRCSHCDEHGPAWSTSSTLSTLSNPRVNLVNPVNLVQKTPVQA